MAIQHRRGSYTDFDPQKMKPAEIAVVQSNDPIATDGQAVYVAFQAGTVKRMATHDELEDYNDQSQAILNSVTQTAQNVQTTYNNTVAKANEASQSATAASNAQTAAEQAKSDTQALFNSAESAIEGYTADAEADINAALADAQAALDTKESDAIDSINQAYQAREAEMNAKIDQMIAVKTNAEEVANQAMSKAIAAENEAATTGGKLDNVNQKLTNLEFDVDTLVAGGYVDTGGYLVLTDIEGNQVGERIGPFAGGGGGGGDTPATNAVMSATNTTGWITNTISGDADCNVKILWSSIENDLPTGNGTATIRVNSVIKAVFEVQQGEITINLSPYLSSGTNAVRVTLADVYGQMRTIVFNIQVVTLRLTSTFDTSNPFSGTISFPYTPVGEVSKTVYFILDGNEIGTQQTSVSNRQMTYVIPAQSHGGHSLRVYFEATINNQTVRSNELYYEFIALEDLNNTVIIVSPYNKTNVQQYDSIIVPYTVYDPASPTAEVTLALNGTELSTQTVDRTQQSYTFRVNEPGTSVFTITSKTTVKRFTLSVEEVDIDVEPETQDLALYLSSEGRSNNEANPEVWTFNNIETTFTGFNGTNDRWQADNDGNIACRVSGNARLNINYRPHAVDFRTTGKTIELEFATRDVLNYDATILSCMSGGRGFSITAQRAMLASEQSAISTQYKEDEHVRISFVVNKRSQNRLLMIYINGIVSGVVQYPDDDDFAQVEPVTISVGSNDCTIDLYTIRVYDNNLTKEQILNNWIADTQNGGDMLDRYKRNNVYDAYGNIVINALPADLPYMIIEAPVLPQYKGDKKTCSGSFVNNVLPSKSFTFTNCQIDVQGTSSQYYERKNYKMKFNGGFVTNSGTISKYALTNDSIPVKTFTMKADVASSEGANNVELARAYNDICPYKTPAQEEDAKVRQGIDGFPMVIFWSDGENTTFLGKYNFNNDKGTEETFGFVDGDESWEIKNNTGLRVLWKSADYEGTDWLNDFEARYPDEDPAYTDASQLKAFAEWAMSTDTEAATGDALPEPVTYGTGDNAVTYTNDTAEYRLAKFKNEASNYMEMESALFYYLFTELFLMVDSRAKNAFPSFMGEEVIL